MNITGFCTYQFVGCRPQVQNLIPCNNRIVDLACCCPAYLKPCNPSSKTSVPLFFQPHTSPLHPLISQSILLTSPFSPPFHFPLILLDRTMASPNGPAADPQFAPVLAALATMQGNVERDQKYQATQFLEQFQKSVGLYSDILAF